MKATDQLKEEHESIKMMLSIMENFINKIKIGEEVDIGHLENMLDFIMVFADKNHHGKEEMVLFPAMIEAGMSFETGPLAVMYNEHEEGRIYIKELTSSLNEYKNGDNSAMKVIVFNANSYITLLRNHIEKENKVLFKMADHVIDESKHDEILKSFQKIELEKLGTSKRVEYLELLNKFKTIYLIELF